jgi:U3 small nucleolar RNA-associated protein 22
MQASADYVNGFLLSMLMAHLLTNAGGKRINLHMTALQIFRVIMDAIVTSTTFQKGVFIQTGKVAGPSAEVRKALLQTFDVVICDSTGLVNLSSRVTKSALAEVCAAVVTHWSIPFFFLIAPFVNFFF